MFPPPSFTDLVLSLRVAKVWKTRQVAAWFRPKSPEEFAPERFPVFVLETEFDAIYGFPDFAGTGVKAASHHQSGFLPHADAATQDGGAADEGRIRAVIAVTCPRQQER